MPPGGRPIVEPEAEADPIEALYARGVTDGLPVVPPTPDRVRRAIEACGRHGGDLVALVPPNYGRATVEKIAVNAVMAGCRPEYLPVVIAAVEAVCDEAFDLHGVSATTNAPSPLVIVNGPVRAALDVNCGAGVFGSDRRAEPGRGGQPQDDALGRHAPGAVARTRADHRGRRVDEGGHPPQSLRATAAPGARPRSRQGRRRRAARARAAEVQAPPGRRDADPEVSVAGESQDRRRRRHRRAVLGDRPRLDLFQGLQPGLQEDPHPVKEGPMSLNPPDEYMDPTDSVAVPRKTARRPATLEGTVITLLDISKAKSDHLLDRIEELLRERARPQAIVRKKKPTFARPAPDPLRQEIVGRTDVLIEALAD